MSIRKNRAEAKLHRTMPQSVKRCPWPTDDPLMIEYHDHEWGMPVHDDRLLYEYLLLDAMQAGLSWKTILHKRENFRKAFHDFDVRRIARYTGKDVARLLNDSGIVRNRLKIGAAVENARRFLEVQKEFGTFDAYIWQFTGGQMKRNRCKTLRDIPVQSAESDAMSRDLQKRGFKFVGSTICYAFMQAAGMVNDHLISCYRYREVMEL
jgi:DNA-3-methyladenine glycosylase I